MGSIQFKDCEEKQRVREELWKPVLEHVFNRTSKNIRYLTLPGAGCYELRKFLDLKLIKLENTVCIESWDDAVDNIRTFCAAEVGFDIEKIKNTIYHAKFEEIIKDDAFIRKHLPFHIVNLDAYCESPLVTNKEDVSKVFDLIDTIIKNHFPFTKDLFLIITVKLDPRLLTGDYAITISNIKSKFVKPLLEDIGDTQFITWASAQQNELEWLKIFSTICYSINSADKYTNLILYSKPYTYIGQSAKKSTRMLSYVFRVKYNDKSSVKQQDIKNRKRQMLTKAIDLIKETVWIN
ncbi:MAG: hypothetical protein V1859_06480 [archaeon]